MSFWGELKRRHVFKVCAAYAVVAWLGVQVADVVLPAFAAPAWVLQSFLVLISLGFLVTAILSWIYELTPGGVKRAEDVAEDENAVAPFGRKLDFAIIAVLFVAVGFLGLSKYPGPNTVTGSLDVTPSLAVLAFSNRSASADDAYFADGLADELISVLGRLPELKVASRTASFSFQGKEVDVPTIAETLQVGYVLSGSVRRSDDRIRVTVTLDGTERNDLVWSQTYDRQIDDIIEIQSDIARSVGLAIVPVLSSRSVDRIAAHPTEIAEAYDYYLRGRDYLREPAETSTLMSATELFDRAISLDPEFAEAYAGLCDTYLNTYSVVGSSDAFEKAETACHRALTLDKEAWQVQSAIGRLYQFSGQYDKAISALETAISQQPNAGELYLELGFTYRQSGRLQMAEEMYLRAKQLERGNYSVHNLLGRLYLDESRNDEAVESFKTVIQLVPDNALGYDNLGNTYLAMGALSEAVETFSASPSPSWWTYSNRGLTRYYLGQFADAVGDFERAIDLTPDNYQIWGFLADTYRFIPDREQRAGAAYAEAIRLAEEKLRVNPVDLLVTTRLATYYAHVGEIDKADALIRHTQELSDDDFASSGWTYYAALVALEQNDMETAYEYFRQAIDAAGWSRSLILSDPYLIRHSGEERFSQL